MRNTKHRPAEVLARRGSTLSVDCGSRKQNTVTPELLSLIRDELL